MRTCNLTPQARVEREAKDDDSLLESDWLTRIGAPLLRLGEVPHDTKPNRTRAMVYFGVRREQYLPMAFAIDYNKRTSDQALSHLGQTQYGQKGTR